MDVSVRRVGLKDERRVRVAKFDGRLVAETFRAVDDGCLAAAASNDVSQLRRHRRIDVAFVEDVDAARVDIDAPLVAAAVEVEVLRDERRSDVLEARRVARHRWTFEPRIPELKRRFFN